MKKRLVYGYSPQLALCGADAPLPPIETWPNQHRGYEIKIEQPEFTSVCPKTKLPDFGTLTLVYFPDRLCLELKSFKYYLLGYRNMGIFYENAVNRILDDVVAAVKPRWAVLEGAFTTRGGMRSTITARHPRTRR
ncbi:MAG: NADPH-dependent 7-cyano-7-deazaguanine reductase QueF [Elusimicrobia bacterium]|nr:NADPH-dependent 7-cyano-7-deazaguanine reductase QueF [Elusimicrobiota bacterium]MDE2236424.1 NADPH-dependent 7-cyano-7-deazaguanine reductase QueF [Elusimicrobiota bacterium]MDE2426066.1 NADPH-dependent 7-cyano-7-deazaguanine reductase QueF [Elusimicrobiota bacterium]